MINILLSVRQPFSGLIMDKKKKWELRKNAPRIPRGEHVTLWLYESGQYGTRGIIGLTRPPQSWQYISPAQAAILERRIA